MIARLLGSEPGRVKRTAQALVPELGLVRESEVLGAPRPLIPALVLVLVGFVSLVPGFLLPMSTLAQW